jgi:hypothetical protein
VTQPYGIFGQRRRQEKADFELPRTVALIGGDSGEVLAEDEGVDVVCAFVGFH